MADIGNTLDDSSNALSDAFTDSANDPDKASDAISALQDQIREVAGQLEDITPPEEVEDPHNDLIEGLRGMADNLDGLKDAVESKDVSAMTEFAKDFTSSEAANQINEAMNELKEKGYNIEGTS